jgi:hypothetical protein
MVEFMGQYRGGLVQIIMIIWKKETTKFNAKHKYDKTLLT